MVQEPIPTPPLSWTFLSQALNAVNSTHSGKTADLLFFIEEQTPCALSFQPLKKKSTLSQHLSELAMLFLGSENLLTSTDLTATLSQGCSHRTNSHNLLQLLGRN